MAFTLTGARFNNTFQQLPEHFYSRVNPTAVANPQLIAINRPLAIELGLSPEELTTGAGPAILAGNVSLSHTNPIAQVYAGHQFGQYNPQLGDGRAILLGELEDTNGKLNDLQLKGAGPTPYSRGGDGRAALGPVIREYLVSEAMHALGIKTTRALAAVTTGEAVYRQQPLPGAVLTRIASSHIRIGTFEFFRAQGDANAVRQLADYAIQRHYPEALEAENPYLAFLECVLTAQAHLVASWLNVGFIHGVMNTDNMTISGETIDYGPCAFMDAYDPSTVFSSIDHHGRYAYAKQGDITLWNITRLAECLLTLFDSNMDTAVDKAQNVLSTFAPIFNSAWKQGMSKKLGLTDECDNDEILIQTVLTLMQKNQADFTLTFRTLSSCVNSTQYQPFLNAFKDTPNEIQQWLQQWQQRIVNTPAEQTAQVMNNVNPLYIPRNYHVEAIIKTAVEEQNYTPLHNLHEVLKTPFTEQEGMTHYAQPPVPSNVPYQTFCGT